MLLRESEQAIDRFALVQIVSLGLLQFVSFASSSLTNSNVFYSIYSSSSLQLYLIFNVFFPQHTVVNNKVREKT